VSGWPGTAVIRDSYARLADEYIAATKDFDRFPGLRAELLGFLRSLPEGPLLDLGCGAGRDSALALSLGRQVVLADVCLELLAKARLRIGAELVVCCDATALPFRDGTFAGVVASGVLLHLPPASVSSALEGIHRVLAAGGRAAISMKHGGRDGWRTSTDFPCPRWFSYHDPEEFADMCREVGLKVLDVVVSGRKDWYTVIAEPARRVDDTGSTSRDGGGPTPPPDG
jgi:tRNA (uracil-5-)-methyltransferase TRM9